MRTKEMDKFIAHCDQYFQQNDATVIHATDNRSPHIDVLLYKPNEAYPFWKLVTMGASDYQMPKVPNALGDRNEYIMFIDPSEDLNKQEILFWYYYKLLLMANYPIEMKCHVSYGHSVEWGEEDGSDMVSAFIEMPQVISDVSFLRCKLGLFKQATCLQVILLTRAETEKLLKIGPHRFSDYLYPEDGEHAHFICEKTRSEHF